MQLMPATARRYGAFRPFDIEQNIAAGTRYVTTLMWEFHCDLRLVAAAYYAGDRWVAEKQLDYGKNTGKNFLVRAGSGIGSVLAEIAGNNSSAAFSEDDMLRERIAENIGTAGDSEVMNLTANSRIFVSVPADTEIYVVFTKDEGGGAQPQKTSAANP